jgi:chorismate mutase
MRFPAAAVRFLLTAVVVLLAGCAPVPPAADVDGIDRILTLIQQRLGYMDDVARNKWNSGAPIEDLPREREIIDGLGRQAAGYGLDAAIARDFFRAQIEASKIIQRARFAEWRAQNQPPFKDMPDLRERIRPALDALTPEMMKALVASLPALQGPGGQVLVTARANSIFGHKDIAARDEAVAPLMRVSRLR